MSSDEVGIGFHPAPFCLDWLSSLLQCTSLRLLFCTVHNHTSNVRAGPNSTEHSTESVATDARVATATSTRSWPCRARVIKSLPKRLVTTTYVRLAHTLVDHSRKALHATCTATWKLHSSTRQTPQPTAVRATGAARQYLRIYLSHHSRPADLTASERAFATKANR